MSRLCVLVLLASLACSAKAWRWKWKEDTSADGVVTVAADAPVLYRPARTVLLQLPVRFAPRQVPPHQGPYGYQSAYVPYGLYGLPSAHAHSSSTVTAAAVAAAVTRTILESSGWLQQGPAFGTRDLSQTPYYGPAGGASGDWTPPVSSQLSPVNGWGHTGVKSGAGGSGSWSIRQA